MTDRQIEREVVAKATRLGFAKVREYFGSVVHDNAITEGRILTFRRTG